MDTWTKWVEFFCCGLMVLPLVLGIGFDSFEVFAATLGLMQVALILVTLGSPAVDPEEIHDPKKPESLHRRD